MTLAAAVALTLTALGTDVGVVVAHHTGVSDDAARATAEQVFSAVRAQGVVARNELDTRRGFSSLGLGDVSTCTTRRPCVVESGKALELWAVVTVSVSELDGERSLVLELVTMADAQTVVRESALYPSTKPPPADVLARFATKVKPLQPPPVVTPPPVVVVAPPEPPKPTLTPAPAPAPTPLAATLVEKRGPSVPALVVGGAAVVAVAVAVGLFAASMGARGELEAAESTREGRRVSSLTETQAAAVANRANAQATGALTSALLAGALGGVTVLTW